MKKKEKIQFMTYREMINYAADKYPVLKKALERDRNERHFKQIRQKINRTLEEYKIKYIWTEETENTNENENDVSKNTEEIKSDVPKKRHKDDDDNIIVPKPFGECVMDKILAPYLIERYGYPQKTYSQQMVVPSKEDFDKMYEKSLKNPESDEFTQISDKDYLPFMEASDQYFPEAKYETANKLISVILTDYLDFDMAELRKDLEGQVDHAFKAILDILVDNIANESFKIVDKIINMHIINLKSKLSKDEAKKIDEIINAQKGLSNNEWEKIYYNEFSDEFKNLNIIPEEIKDMVCWDVVFNLMKDWDNYDEYDKRSNLKSRLRAILTDFMVNERINDVFCSFFDFDREKFLNDLENRARLINENSPDINDGSSSAIDDYSKLTWKLKNPVGIYVFPKRAGVNTHDE